MGRRQAASAEMGFSILAARRERGPGWGRSHALRNERGGGACLEGFWRGTETGMGWRQGLWGKGPGRRWLERRDGVGRGPSLRIGKDGVEL